MSKEQFIHIDAKGNKFYYSDREMNHMKFLHREDGPAIEGADGYKSWWLNGEYLTEEEFNARMNPVELTEQDAWQEATDNWIKLTLEKYNGFDPDELTQVFMLGPFAGWSERMVYDLACKMDDANKRAPRHKQEDAKSDDCQSVWNDCNYSWVD